MNISNRLRSARDLNAGLKSEYESARIGTLRGGSSGMMSPDGLGVVGKCPRLSYLRSGGYLVDEKHAEDKLVIFDRGKDQEFSIVSDLKSTLAPGEVLLCEDEVPTSWLTTNNTRVTGRPDGVICRVGGPGDLNKIPVVGLEIKSVGSIWVSRDVLLERSPRLDHLIQAVHYSWQLGNLPWKLIYRQNSSLVIPNYPGLFKLPRYDDESHPLHGLIKYNKRNEPQEIKPYTLVYDLRIDTRSGMLSFKLESESDSEWRSTIVSTSDIRRYFEHVSRIGETQDPGPVPSAVDWSGKKLNFNQCDYCPLGDLCCGKKGGKLDFETWFEEAKKQSTRVGPGRSGGDK